MRSTRRVSALFGLLSALLVGCPELPEGPRFRGAGARDARPGGTLMLWEESRVRLLDPHRAGDQISHVLVAMLFDPLYEYDLAMKLVPCLAAALPEIASDGRTFTIRLRNDVRFHNGRLLTAHDVAWSLERMLAPDLHSPGATYFRAVTGFADFRERRSAHVRGFEVLDASTLRIALDRPDQSFVHVLAMHYAAPVAREDLERAGSDARTRPPSGTGPFRLESWDPGVRLVLKRHPRYFAPEHARLERIVFEEGLKSDTAFLRFRNGEVDVLPRVSAADQMMLERPAWRPYRAFSAKADVYGIVMNSQLAPFDNVHVRRAVAFALDRERWSRARNGAIRPSGQLVPPGVPGYDPALPNQQRFDLRRAREEMRLAGHPNGLSEPVTLWVLEGAKSLTYGQLLQADLAKIGIEVQLKTSSFPVYLEETGKPKTAQMVAAGWGMDFPDASNVLGLVSSATLAPRDSQNRSFFADPFLDDLLERALVEREPTRRTAMYREANDFAAKMAPWAVYGNTQVPQAWQPYVRGYSPHPFRWIPVKGVWLDLPRKRIASLLAPSLRERALASVLAPLVSP